MRAQRQRKVDGHGPRMKQIKRPDVDGAAGKIGTSWGGRFNDHFDYSNLIGGGFEI
jgi:hypothetical protein